MNQLPTSIQYYLANLRQEKEHFAYLNFDHQERVTDWSSNISYYGILDLHQGDKVVEKLVFLEGLMPYQEADILILPSINFSNDVVADIHIVPKITGISILFFDVTQAVKQQQVLQQERHNLALLYQQQHKNLVLLKQTYQELEAKKEQAEIANKEKTRLLSYITHDLRTPLTAILSFSQFLESGVFGELNEKQRDSILKIIDTGMHMNDLINSILEAARFESGYIELNPELVDPIVVITECISWLQPIADKQKISIVSRLDREIKILVDIKRFKQIIINLLSNAIKYNRKNGLVMVAYTLLENHLRIRIKDTGIGMSDKQTEKLFQPFSRVLNKDKAKEIEGTGIGLSESKKLVELMDGSLSVRSESDVGSIFYLDLPLAGASINKKVHNFNKLVYFYQDSANFELFTHLFIYCRHCQIFGFTQIDEVLQFCNQQPVTLVLIDINITELTKSIEEIKLLKSTIKQLFIIAVFNKETPISIISEVLVQSNADDYLLCPFDFNQLLDIIE